jgi:hypothetical protein
VTARNAGSQNSVSKTALSQARDVTRKSLFAAGFVLEPAPANL